MAAPPRAAHPDRAAAADEGPLVARAAAGDEAAFAVLVERYAARTHGLALRIVRDPADAEEVAQDAFVRAWRGLPAFRGQASFGTWLYRIVARQAFDRASVLANRRRREDVMADVPVGEGTPPAADGGEDVEALVADLPAVQRAVVTLFYYEDRSVRDVAAALGLPEGTVKTHLFRARAALRAAYLTHGREED